MQIIIFTWSWFCTLILYHTCRFSTWLRCIRIHFQVLLRFLWFRFQRWLYINIQWGTIELNLNILSYELNTWRDLVFSLYSYASCTLSVWGDRQQILNSVVRSFRCKKYICYISLSVNWFLCTLLLCHRFHWEYSFYIRFSKSGNVSCVVSRPTLSIPHWALLLLGLLSHN